MNKLFIVLVSLSIISLVFSFRCASNSTMFCTDRDTCCLAQNGTQWRCCPGQYSTCCSDGLSCCPGGTVCDLRNRRCLPKFLSATNFSEEIDMLSSVASRGVQFPSIDKIMNCISFFFLVWQVPEVKSQFENIFNLYQQKKFFEVLVSLANLSGKGKEIYNSCK